MSNSNLATIDELLAEGRTAQAAQHAQQLPVDTDDPGRDLRLAIAFMGDPEVPTDESLLLLERVLRSSSRVSGRELILARCQQVACYVRKRVRPLAQQALDAAVTAGLETEPDVLVARGRMHVAFDERAEARECFAQALTAQPAHVEARLASADLSYVLGEFAKTLDLTNTITTDPPTGRNFFGPADQVTSAQWRQALQLAAAGHAATGAYAEEVEVWTRLISTADNEAELSDRINLAFAHAALGDYGAAEEQLRVVHKSDPDSPRGRYARKRVDYLTAKDGPDQAVKRLKQFPTTSQKYNYCGPAVLELCLSFLDMELSQDEIADVVKREHGTPMFEMTSFLQTHNILARRIEATPARIRTAIDLGLPVIVQEEYSTTSHVAVITGYDGRLGSFIANDPATHRPLFKSFEWTERSGDLFGNGGIVILGRKDASGIEQLIQQADERGLRHEPHLELLDTADAHRNQLESDSGPEVARDQIIHICDQAIDINGDFRLAWYRKLRALFGLRQIRRTQSAHDLFIDFLHRVRVRFPHDEWTHQVHAHYLASCDRHHEAFAEFLEASRLDPSDSNNKQSMGECKTAGGDLVLGERHLLNALALDPEHVRAAENLAGLYVRQLEATPEETGEDTTWSTRSTSEDIHVPLEHPRDHILERAEHFSRVATSSNASNPYNHYVAGTVARLQGELETALRCHEQALGLDQQRPHSHLEVAHALLDLNRHEQALKVAETMCTQFADYNESWLLLAEVHRRSQQHDQAQQAILKGADACGHGREAFVKPMFAASHLVLGSKEAAGSVVREFAETHWGDGAFMREAAYTLDAEGLRGHAIAMLRHVLQQSPNDVQTMFRLGSLLTEDITTQQEGKSLLEQVCEYVPDSALVRVRLAWQYWKTDPTVGLDILKPVLDSQDADVYEAAAILGLATGNEQLFNTMRARALGSYRSEVHARINLGWHHIRYDRYDLALEHSLALRDLEVKGDDIKEAEDLEYTAHRLAGRCTDLHDRAKARCKDGVPIHLAWDIYYGFRSIDYNLSAQAALAVAKDKTDHNEKLEWRTHAAGRLALAGDTSMIDAIEDELGECGVAWASLSWEYAWLERYADANKAAQRGFELAPKDVQVLCAIQAAELRQGNLEAAMSFAARALELHPYQHIGNERLALLLAKQFATEEALKHSTRSVDLAPFCHISMDSHAVSLLVAGQLEAAQMYAQRSLALDPPVSDHEDNDSLMITYALAGDTDKLSRCLAEHTKEYPPTLFARYHEHLQHIAGERAT